MEDDDYIPFESFRPLGESVDGLRVRDLLPEEIEQIQKTIEKIRAKQAARKSK